MHHPAALHVGTTAVGLRIVHEELHCNVGVILPVHRVRDVKLEFQDICHVLLLALGEGCGVAERVHAEAHGVAARHPGAAASRWHSTALGQVDGGHKRRIGAPEDRELVDAGPLEVGDLDVGLAPWEQEHVQRKRDINGVCAGRPGVALPDVPGCKPCLADVQRSPLLEGCVDGPRRPRPRRKRNCPLVTGRDARQLARIHCPVRVCGCITAVCLQAGVHEHLTGAPA